MRHKYQGLPVEGYTAWTNNMLAGIPLWLNFDYLKDRGAVTARRMLIFTGPIDELFGFDLGRLVYRGQRRSSRYVAGVDYAQPCGQVNNPQPDDGSHIRTLEWKHMMCPERAQSIPGTVLTTEVPFTPNDPDRYEYPFPDDANRALFERYEQRAKTHPDLLVCGRLGEYRYYDMDQAIGRAMRLARTILSK